MVPALEATLDDLGIDLRSQRNVELDLEDRPNKSPLAHCWPVLIPDRVYLLLRPQGGLNDCLSLFHEMGHALHYTFTKPSEDFEFKYLGDYAMTETYAFLFQYFTLNDDGSRPRAPCSSSGSSAGTARS